MNPSTASNIIETTNIAHCDPRAIQCRDNLTSTLAICSIGELFGGVERHILGLIETLHARGVFPLLILFHDGELAARARRLGVRPTILPNNNRKFLSIAKDLASALRSHKAAVVHAHGSKAIVYSAMARLWHPFALVKTEHGLPEPATNGLLRGIRGRVYRFLDLAATRLTKSRVCYVTEAIENHFRRLHTGLTIETVPNGIDPIDRTTLSRPAEFHDERFNLTIVGRLDAVKGHRYAIEAMGCEELPPDVHLYIVGSGPLRAQLQGLCRQLGVASRVHFLGFRRNAFDYIAFSNALLMPSLHEGLPYTILEAMELRTPIIATNVGGLPGLIRDGVTGLLIPPRDAQAIARSIRRLYDTPDLARRLADGAQVVRRTEYTQDLMATRYLRIYRHALQRLGSRPQGQRTIGKSR